MHHHKWPMDYIDNLLPFEKEIYSNLLMKFLKEEENRMKQQEVQQQFQGSTNSG